MRLSFLFALATTFILSACGGGGGSSGAVSGGGTGAGPNVGGATSAPTLAVTVVDASGAQARNISIGGGFSARATLRDAAGAPVAGKAVQFSLNGGSIAVLMPDSALTDAAGVAQVSISPSSVSAVGAATVSASAVVDSVTVSGQTDFAVAASDISLSALAVGTSSLASGGDTSLSVTVLVGGAPAAGIPVNVSFSTSCGRINGSGSSASVSANGNGVASAVYTAVAADGSLCSGPVTVTAASAGASTRSATITVAPPVANAISFVSATPAQIFIAGSGALEQSLVRFKVFAGATPLANTAVKFSLQINPGGVGLNASGSSADVQTTTNAQGEATVQVFSGTIPGPVRVRAALVSDPTVFAETQNLTVASGPPSQRFMSLSVQTFNIEGAAIDGVGTKLTVRLADRQGNPVEDGTVVNFTAEGGQVASNCATSKTNGISSCSVDFISQNPRPAGGRVSVLAFTSGTKDYVDLNGNNRYDSGDTLVNLGDAYRDDNENASFDAGEFVVPRGGTQACAGAGAPFPSRADTCDGNLATTVRQQTTILFSSSSPVVDVVSSSSSELNFKLRSADNLLLPMPSGTGVSAVASDQTADNNLACAVDQLLGTTVPSVSPGVNPSADLATSHSVSLKNCAAGDSVTIKVTAPSGLITSFKHTF